MGRLSKRLSGPVASILPRDKNDVAGAARAVACGLPALEPALPELLKWLRDLRWPVAPVLIPFFAAHGEASLRHVRRALTSRNGLWKANLLREVVARWDPAPVPALKFELETLATAFDPAGADLAAIALLSCTGSPNPPGSVGGWRSSARACTSWSRNPAGSRRCSPGAIHADPRREAFYQ